MIDITIPVDIEGGHDLHFALDGTLSKDHTSPISVIVRPTHPGGAPPSPRS